MQRHSVGPEASFLVSCDHLDQNGQQRAARVLLVAEAGTGTTACGCAGLGERYAIGTIKASLGTPTRDRARNRLRTTLGPKSLVNRSRAAPAALCSRVDTDAEVKATRPPACATIFYRAGCAARTMTNALSAQQGRGSCAGPVSPLESRAGVGPPRLFAGAECWRGVVLDH